ncbi:MAG: hypothetical protein HOJ38_02555 [Rhodobiaceae bacterium]|nr:hypothetical protein [Rhodobiaceae bacterium]MBT5640453.1 hypothetical protein [Rhodobiaceae bacterium]
MNGFLIFNRFHSTASILEALSSIVILLIVIFFSLIFYHRISNIASISTEASRGREWQLIAYHQQLLAALI